MSDGAIVGLVVWLSLVGLAGLVFALRRPTPVEKRRTPEEWEAGLAAMRNRIIDLEDKHESFVKRQAVRSGRARVDEEQAPLPFDRGARLHAAKARAAIRFGKAI